MAREFMILDLDGTIIPFDFELEFCKLAITYCNNIASKILARFFLILNPILYRLYVLSLKILIKVIGVKTRSEYLSLSVRKSYFASLLSFFYKLDFSDVNKCVGAALLDGLKRRKVVWNEVITHHVKNRNKSKCLLVTGSGVLPLIEKVRHLFMVDCVFRSYATALGALVLEYEVNKAKIANSIANIQKKIDVVISDSMEDLKAFSYANRKMLVRNDGSLTEIPL